MPSAKHIGIFDTAWYSHLPEYAFLYSLPIELYREHGIRRYGFHGTSHEYMANEIADKLNKPLNSCNLITCHLGSGDSVTAIRHGVPIDTSMGFTPLEGLTMGTRVGDVDAAAILYLIMELGWDADSVAEMLNKQSGLKGLTGTSDMRDILIAAGHEVPDYSPSMNIEPEIARVALEIFVYDVQRYIGSYMSFMDSIDGIVFSGGIGEHSDVIRNLVLAGLPKIDSDIVHVVEANEELAIAKQVMLYGGQES